MTSRLERKTRELADGYMQKNPGVPRQEAKRRVLVKAKFLLLDEQIHEAHKRMDRAVFSRCLEFKRRARG